ASRPLPLPARCRSPRRRSAVHPLREISDFGSGILDFGFGRRDGHAPLRKGGLGGSGEVVIRDPTPRQDPCLIFQFSFFNRHRAHPEVQPPSPRLPCPPPDFTIHSNHASFSSDSSISPFDALSSGETIRTAPSSRTFLASASRIQYPPAGNLGTSPCPETV